MALHERDIHGHKVSGEDNVVKGMEYLDYRLSYEEAEVFFREARNRGKVQFEDGEHRNYTLTHRGGLYSLTRRKSGGFWSWF